jgi:hypothetical protein
MLPEARGVWKVEHATTKLAKGQGRGVRVITRGRFLSGWRLLSSQDIFSVVQVLGC